MKIAVSSMGENPDAAIITGVQGTVGEAIGAYLKGEFKPAESPTVGSHHGQT